MTSSEVGKIRNPLTGRYGRLINVDGPLGALQAETAKTISASGRHTGEINASTIAFISEMTAAMETILQRLQELVERQTDPDGVREITSLADRLANARTSEPKRRVGFIPPDGGDAA